MRSRIITIYTIIIQSTYGQYFNAELNPYSYNVQPDLNPDFGDNGYIPNSYDRYDPRDKPVSNYYGVSGLIPNPYQSNGMESVINNGYTNIHSINSGISGDISELNFASQIPEPIYPTIFEHQYIRDPYALPEVILTPPDNPLHSEVHLPEPYLYNIPDPILNPLEADFNSYIAHIPTIPEAQNSGYIPEPKVNSPETDIFGHKVDIIANPLNSMGNIHIPEPQNTGYIQEPLLNSPETNFNPLDSDQNSYEPNTPETQNSEYTPETIIGSPESHINNHSPDLVPNPNNSDENSFTPNTSEAQNTEYIPETIIDSPESHINKNTPDLIPNPYDSDENSFIPNTPEAQHTEYIPETIIGSPESPPEAHDMYTPDNTYQVIDELGYLLNKLNFLINKNTNNNKNDHFEVQESNLKVINDTEEQLIVPIFDSQNNSDVEIIKETGKNNDFQKNNLYEIQQDEAETKPNDAIPDLIVPVFDSHNKSDVEITQGTDKNSDESIGNTTQNNNTTETQQDGSVNERKDTVPDLIVPVLESFNNSDVEKIQETDNNSDVPIKDMNISDDLIGNTTQRNISEILHASKNENAVPDLIVPVYNFSNITDVPEVNLDTDTNSHDYLIVATNINSDVPTKESTTSANTQRNIRNTIKNENSVFNSDDVIESAKKQSYTYIVKKYINVPGNISKETATSAVTTPDFTETTEPTTKLAVATTVKPVPITPKDQDACGWSNPGGLEPIEDSERKIIIDQAEFAEYPWMVALIKKTNNSGILWKQEDYLGGGTLIHRSVVITAAHKVDNWRSNQIKCLAGVLDMLTQNEKYPHQEINVRKMVIHPQFRRVTHYYNIAVLFLEKPFVLAPNIGIACLGLMMPDPGTRCESMGWGKNTDGRSNNGILKKIQLPLVDVDHCQNSLRNTRLGTSFEVHHTLTCAGGEVGKDTCVGDGGASLVCPIDGQPGRYAVYGLVSFGIRCGIAGRPGLYVDMTQLVGWVGDTISEEGYSADSYGF